MRCRHATSLVGILAMALACHSTLETFSQETDFVPAEKAATPVALAKQVTIVDIPGSLRKESQEKLTAGTRWRFIGRVIEGDVYECVDGVFMLHARYYHEAHLVVSKERLVGLYLPVRDRVVALDPPVEIRFR